MSTTLPVTIRLSSLPSTGEWTPQQWAQEVAARLSIVSDGDVALFQIGTQLPTSDEGPFLLNGVSWYVWDVSTGAYIPQIIPFEALRYIAQQSDPDPNKFTFWIVTDSGGVATDIRYYSGGSWKSVFDGKFALYSTTAQMNTAITSAISAYAATDIRYPARATPSINQTVSVNSAPHKLNFETESLDPNSAYDAANSRYIAQVSGIYRVSLDLQIDNGTATASGMV